MSEERMCRVVCAYEWGGRCGAVWWTTVYVTREVCDWEVRESVNGRGYKNGQVQLRMRQNLIASSHFHSSPDSVNLGRS